MSSNAYGREVSGRQDGKPVTNSADAPSNNDAFSSTLFACTVATAVKFDVGTASVTSSVAFKEG